MAATEIAQDGTVVVRTLVAPARGLAEAVGRRRVATALLVATLASLLHVAVLEPRVDYEAVAAAKLARNPQAAEMTQHDREEAVATARKLGHVAGFGGALLGPAFGTLIVAAFLFLGFRVAGTKPAFKPTYAATVHGMMPVLLAPLLAIPAILARGLVGPQDAAHLLPSSPAAFFPGAPPPLAGALSALDVFALWSVALLALGMARASGASRRRAFVVTLVLFLSYVAVFQVALPALLSGGPGPGPRGGS